MSHTIAILAALILGYLAQRLGICMVRATRATLKGSPALLIAILLSGAWIWLYSITAHYNDWALPFVRYEFHPVFAIGGFIFGLGSSINQGCSISTMNQLARGHTGKMLTVMGWFLGWSIWIQLLRQKFISIDYVTKQALSLNDIIIVAVATSITVVICVLKFKPPLKLMFGVLGIGLISSLLYYLEPKWPPSKLMNDMGSVVLFGHEMPSFLRMALIVGLLAGMWIAVAINHNARLRLPRWRSAIRFLVAGTMMGIGSAMALGGNDTQLLFGIPASSPGALSALAFMFVGIACEQILYQRGTLFYKKR